MFFYVYILESEKTGGLYVGQTTNLKNRVEEHNRGLFKKLFGISRPVKTPAFRAKNELEPEPYRDMVRAKRRFVAEMLLFWRTSCCFEPYFASRS